MIGAFHRRGTRDAETLVARAVQRLGKETSWLPQAEIRKLPELQAMLNAPDELRRQCVLAAARASMQIEGDQFSWNSPPQIAGEILAIIARKRLSLDAADLAELLDVSCSGRSHLEQYAGSRVLRDLCAQIEVAYPALPAEEQAKLVPQLETALSCSRDPTTARRLQKLLAARTDDLLWLVSDGDGVGPRLREVFCSGEEPQESKTELLHLLASYPAKGKPTRAWLKRADEVIGALGDAHGLVAAILGAALEAGDTDYDTGTYQYLAFLAGGNEQLLCGAATLAGRLGDPALLPLLRKLAAKSITVIGGQYGSPRSIRLANACANAIAEAATPSSITELLALERSVRHGTLLRSVRKAIDALAEAQGVSRDELLERAVESHELEPDGTKRIALSRGAALVEVSGTTAALSYVDENGSRKKSLPAAVKDADAELLKALRAELKGIRSTIAAERHRLDGLLAETRTWSLEEWRDLYLDHPITGQLARSLIWAFELPSGEELVGMPHEASSLLTSSETVPFPTEAIRARLWHPVEVTADEVRAWRVALLAAEIAQPLKQAFRELYVLTPAEEETRVYSNRFAGHVITQVQARALMKGRGWAPVAVAWWDDGIDHGVARKVFEPFGIRAEFFFDPIYDFEPTAGDLYPYCTSDQVRFFDVESGDEIELWNVPPLVFTETMRDVDLFVGVTSIGADPEWLDRGRGRQFDTYWRRVSFGDLSAAAEIRREVLEELVPRLAIADRCKLEERFLVVKGDIRTYRIHLGSSNILMAPNDQYLCIVGVRNSRVEKLFLPFDDDPVLSLILSKAFLLANDTAITDRTITSQIKPD